MIKSEIIADSLSNGVFRTTTFEITIPRIILAEFNTHKSLMKNTSSSRAIPDAAMVKAVSNTPFIPIGYQKKHKGMQGTEYVNKDEAFSVKELIDKITVGVDNDLTKLGISNIIHKACKDQPFVTLDMLWLNARSEMVTIASLLGAAGVTKQIINRLLEPFTWSTLIITGSQYAFENFFDLRCPRYRWADMEENHFANSLKELRHFETNLDEYVNDGQGEIHMMAIAEMMYDMYYMNTSKAKELAPHEWHIPYDSLITDEMINTVIEAGLANDSPLIKLSQRDYAKIKIGVGLVARASYTMIGKNKKQDAIENAKLFDAMISSDPIHASPFEHIGKAMDAYEYYTNIKGSLESNTLRLKYSDQPIITEQSKLPIMDEGWLFNLPDDMKASAEVLGWNKAFKGLIQFRTYIENENLWKN